MQPSMSEGQSVCKIITYLELLLTFTSESITQRAIDQGKITKGPRVQDNLNQITQLPEFKIILRQEVNARRLKEEDVWRNLGILYGVLSRYAHGNNGHIQLWEGYHPENERAGLVALMKLQARWPNPLRWNEEKYR